MSNVDTSDVPTHKVEGCGPMTNTAAHKQHLLLLLVLLYFLYFSLLVGNMQMIFKSLPHLERQHRMRNAIRSRFRLISSHTTGTTSVGDGQFGG